MWVFSQNLQKSSGHPMTKFQKFGKDYGGEPSRDLKQIPTHRAFKMWKKGHRRKLWSIVCT